MGVLLTGGAGYIGSHTAVSLLEAGYDIVIVDNFSNSAHDVPERVFKITGTRPKLYDADVTDAAALERIFSENDIEAVIHLAGFKAVSESVRKPLSYYRNNLDLVFTLLEVMDRHACKRFVFSSSATVYGEGTPSPLTEAAPVGGCTNPYGWTKYMAERVLTDVAKADKSLSAVLLRYFNPVGAHPSGLLGEFPNQTPSNLMPRIARTARGADGPLPIYGGDYPTPDGSGVRDYIHVMDLAEGHLAALKYGAGHRGTEIFNLGVGRGVSVLELIKTFERVNGVRVPFIMRPRREGDVAICVADPEKARRTLGWSAKRSVEEMCRDAWNWEKRRRKP